MPGVRIVEDRLHRDISLEDSSLHIELDGRAIELFFYWVGLPDDADPRDLVRGLRQQIVDHIEQDSPSQWQQLFDNGRIMAITFTKDASSP